MDNRWTGGIVHQWKRASLHYTKADVARAIGIHPGSLSRYCSKHDIDLATLPLEGLVAFINGYPHRGR